MERPRETEEKVVVVVKGFVKVDNAAEEEGFDPVPFRLETPLLFPTFLSRSFQSVVSLKHVRKCRRGERRCPLAIVYPKIGDEIVADLNCLRLNSNMSSPEQ